MGYLSCKAESSILTSNSQTPKQSKHNQTQTHQQKPIKIQEFQYTDLEAATNNFSEHSLLGKGSHGSVYKAVLKSGRLVAVKKPTKSGPESTSEVENEIDILSRIQSPRLVNLVGFTNDVSRKDRLLVVEFMSNGTLYDVIHSSSRIPTWGRRIRLALQTAKAIDTLHSCAPPVIHRDIKSANVLIDRNFNARLGDFGLALRCHVDDYRLLSTPPAGTIGYLDPCYVTPDNLSTKTDVFSFGILLLEIISGRKAIDVGHSPPSIVDWAIPLIKKGKLLAIYDPRIAPPKDHLARKQLAVIAAKCVRSSRERRPSMKEVVEILIGLSKMLPLHSWNGITNPCLMVETMRQPVELKSIRSCMMPQDFDKGIADSDGKFSKPLRNSRRVYSDLNLRNNLIGLIGGHNGVLESGEGGNEEEPNSTPRDRVSKLRTRTGRYVSRGRIHSPDDDGQLGMSRLRRNKSEGVNSEIFSRVEFFTPSRFSARSADLT